LMAEGIRKLHSRNCAAREGGRCRCGAGWEASIYSPKDQKKLRKTFKRKTEAASWRAEAKRNIDRGTLRAPTPTTLREAAEVWLAGIESGAIKNRDGNRFKPATLRGYRQSLEDYILPVLGGERFAQVTTADIQELIDRWEGEGQEPATTRNAIKPLQSLYRRARSRGTVATNPTTDLELPSPTPKKAEIVSPAVADHLVDLAPVEDRAIWAAAVYAGLRYGELRALRWNAVDLAGGFIQVRESWDPKAGPITPKTKTSIRKVPVSGALRDHLLDHQMRIGQPDPDTLVFQKDAGSPFDAVSIYRRADASWRRAELASMDDSALFALAEKAGGTADDDRDRQVRKIMRDKTLAVPDQSLRLHQARHTCASFWIAAGLDPKTVMTYMGHSSITVTYDLYGHLIPGSMDDDRAKLDAFYERANTAARIRAISDKDSV
ncbi:MAG: site-specific integrase, partial [Solirubrobacterales bacterium]|nr:site-specific integrase [Solirubrobacterales bacterium]